jgi:hypothetical protein
MEVGSGTALEGNSPLNVAVPEVFKKTRSPAVVVNVTPSDICSGPLTVTEPEKLGIVPRAAIPCILSAVNWKPNPP